MLELTYYKDANGQLLYEFEGVVDGDSELCLAKLRDVRENVTLVFTQVSRINSMGLALLLAELKNIHEQGIGIAAVGMNRMVSMLFKMTGLHQYLNNGMVAAEAVISVPKETSAEKEKISFPRSPIDKKDESHLRFYVTLQERSQLEGWYFLNTYMQRRSGKSIRIEPHFGALDQDSAAPPEYSDIAFVSPFDICSLVTQGFSVLRYPECAAEEAIIVCRKDDEREKLGEYIKPKIISAQLESYAYLLGRLLLDDSGCPSENANYLFVGNDIKVVQMLLRGMGDLVIVPLRAFNGLAGLVRDRLRVLAKTQTEFAFHGLCVSPKLHGKHKEIEELFDGLSVDQKGRKILAELGIHGWRKPQPEEVDLLLQIHRRYI